MSRIVKRQTGSVGAAISRPRTDQDAVGAAISRQPVSCELTRAGEIVRQAIENIPSIYPAVCVDKYIVMPNHIHMILCIRTEDDGRQVAAPTISTVVGQMKRWSSLQAGLSLWQRSFYDHIVRNDAEYRQIAEYIDGNPARWSEDRFYIPD